jgi:hypothetical protein
MRQRFFDVAFHQQNRFVQFARHLIADGLQTPRDLRLAAISQTLIKNLTRGRVGQFDAVLQRMISSARSVAAMLPQQDTRRESIQYNASSVSTPGNNSLKAARCS